MAENEFDEYPEISMPEILHFEKKDRPYFIFFSEPNGQHQQVLGQARYVISDYVNSETGEELWEPHLLIEGNLTGNDGVVTSQTIERFVPVHDLPKWEIKIDAGRKRHRR